MTHFPLLTVTTFLPLAGAAMIVLLGREHLARWIALATTLATTTTKLGVGAGRPACQKNHQGCENSAKDTWMRRHGVTSFLYARPSRQAKI